MKKFRITINGRTKGAIGIFYKIADGGKFNSITEFRNYIYSKYEINVVFAIEGCSTDEFFNSKD